MTRVRGLLACAVLVTLRAARTSGLAASSSPLPPPSSYAPPGAFPTSLFESYYNDPTATTAQPQPVVSDPVLVRIHLTICEAFRSLILIFQHKIFPPELTDPNDIPQVGRCLVQEEEEEEEEDLSLRYFSPPPFDSRAERHPGSPPPPRARFRRKSLAKRIKPI
jgi:hypothetical protein